jgi:hypothetical protein
VVPWCCPDVDRDIACVCRAFTHFSALSAASFAFAAYPLRIKYCCPVSGPDRLRRGRLHNFAPAAMQACCCPSVIDSLQVLEAAPRLDFHLAALYGVETRNLNKAVKRNLQRFPADFMFQLAPEELGNLRFQVGISSSAHGGRRKPVSAFTEQGVAMLSGVSRSQRAVQVNIAITRAFVRLRETLSVQKELAHKLVDLERTIENHDESIHTLLGAIRQLMTPPEPPHKEIGSHIKEDGVPGRIKRKAARP